MSRFLRFFLRRLAIGSAFLALAPLSGSAQTARISEEIRTLETFPFSEPNPVPILVRDSRLYPYHTFEGYSATSQPQDWKVVKLENEFIEVFVLPEVGGKVWGAVVKETGHEFIYRNEVMKFRNIALRGPWTSGGIEFNFGVIGHTPTTATPVDYTLVENSDGSVSCWVGAMDLPSRTHWRVEIRLPADRAYFETNVLWYNPTPLEQPYYNWMTAAAFARDDLEMSMPGDAYLQHSGRVETWPIDEEGRYLQAYANNTFEGHKSYHVVGELNDFFGGYYHDEDYGFGHWARHEDMPGQKLWLWALSREGGVWEELLTDTDGQYVEFQAGRLFVQYSPGAHQNPITQAGFDPMSASRWTETWFPLEGIGGLTDASREGAMFLEKDDGRLTVAANAFRDIQDTLRVWSGGELLLERPVKLEALKAFETEVEVTPDRDYRVRLPGLELDYTSDPSQRRLSRPFETEAAAWNSLSQADKFVFQARELSKARQYKEARELFEAAVALEPWDREALLGLAEISYRRGLFEVGVGQVNRVLQLDTYDAQANFLAGILHRSLGRHADARDAFGWATRSTTYRAAAYTELAEMELAGGDGKDVAWSEATRYARLAIDSDRNGIRAWQTLAIIGRKTEDSALIQEARSHLLGLDPLHHFVAAEEYLASPGDAVARTFLEAFGGEYPDQNLLELAIGYANLGLAGDALSVLGVGAGARPGAGPLLQAWEAWLDSRPADLLNPGEPQFVFPYRTESLPVLGWAADKTGDWMWEYLLALNLWAVDREEEAAALLEELGTAHDFPPLLVARALLLERMEGTPAPSDLRRAVAADPENRILHIFLIQSLETAGLWEEALHALDEAGGHFPGDFNVDLLRAKALINTNRPLEATEILASTHVLPSENARESHRIWEQAHTMAALDAYEAGDFRAAKGHLMLALEWPEHLGQGRPYQPEERLVQFILGLVEKDLGNDMEARRAFQTYLDATGEVVSPVHPLDLLAAKALGALGRDSEADALFLQIQSEFQAIEATLDDDLEGGLILRALRLGNGDT